MNDLIPRRRFLGLAAAVSAGVSVPLALARNGDATAPAGRPRHSACIEALFTDVPFEDRPAKVKGAGSVPGSLKGQTMILADYNSAPKKADGHIDQCLLIRRLQDAGVNTYFYLIWGWETEWPDLPSFLAKAHAVGINVWVLLVPPSEGWSWPFKHDYMRWTYHLDQLRHANTNLKGWILDDFSDNLDLFTPEYLRDLNNAFRVPFMPVLYPDGITPDLLAKYDGLFTNANVAYAIDRAEMDWVGNILHKTQQLPLVTLICPGDTVTMANEFVAMDTMMVFKPDAPRLLRFQDSFQGAAGRTGSHVRQLAVDDQIVMEIDEAPTAGERPWWKRWTTRSIDLAPLTVGKTQAKITICLYEKQGVYNYTAYWRVRMLPPTGAKVLTEIHRNWQMRKHGPFRVLTDPLPSGTHIHQIATIAGDQPSFEKFYGGAGTPERIAEQVHTAKHATGSVDGIAMYCLDKSPDNLILPAVAAAMKG
jgi:hypothetical protein